MTLYRTVPHDHPDAEYLSCPVVPIGEPVYRIDRVEGCNCPHFRDIMPYRIADLACPVHGVGGTEPGDGYWRLVGIGDTDETL